MTFKVVDARTGAEPDFWRITREEDWAGHLHCGKEGFMLEQDGTLVLADACGNLAYCPPGRFRISAVDLLG